MFGIHWRLSNVFYACTHEFMGMSCCRPWPGSTVSRKWTRQLHHRYSINSNVRLNRGLFRHLITYMASLWRQLIHVHYIGLTMSVALLREGGKYYRKCNSVETFQRCQSDIAHQSNNFPKNKSGEREKTHIFSLLWSKRNDVPKLVLKILNHWLWQGELNFSVEVDMTSH